MNGIASFRSGDRRRVLLEQAFILHRRAYRETSLLLEIFSKSSGRLRLLAKGAKRGRNSLSHHLQPFVLSHLSWTGRSDLPVLIAAESTDEVIRLDGTGLFCGFYLNELLLHLLPPQDPHPRVFRLYLDALNQLATEQHQEQVLRGFEIVLLEEIGYGLALDREAHGQVIDPAKSYAYVLDQGPIETKPGGPDSVMGSTLLGLQRGCLEHPDALREAKRLMRRVIHHYLGGYTLKSRDLFKSLARL